jgi:uncharacterized protein (DUF1501 family)
MSTTRRRFLGQLGAAGLLSVGGLPPEFLCRAARAADQAKNDGRILVLVELEGGNDGLNTVIPFGDDEYYKARPGLGVDRDQILKLDDYHGLHPGLAGLKSLYDEGRLAVLQGVGYPNPDRSHFRSMDIWHSAEPERETFDRGWLGRMLDAQAGAADAQSPALALGVQRLPLALVASKINVPAVSDLSAYRLEVGSGSSELQAARRKLLAELAERNGHAGAELDFLRQTALTAYRSAERLRSVTEGYKAAAEYPASGLGEQLKLIAQIIASGLETRIFFVSLSGFDTHSQQAPAHQLLLAELGDAVQAFHKDLAGHGLAERVMLVTFSEFGRRVKENGSLGTDHGAASQMFVMTPLTGGIVGKHPSLTELTDGDLIHHTDFRAVYATLLERWLGLPSEGVLGGRFAPLAFAG